MEVLWMENKLIINSIVIDSERITIQYDISGEWTKYFSDHRDFSIKYSRNIDKSSSSIAIIPFLGNVLPVSWIADAHVVVEELDKDFYECIEQVKAGYQNMYPSVPFGGKILVNKIIDNQANGTSSMCLFSGGVDSISTWISHQHEDLHLASIWGSDIRLDNPAGWEVMKGKLSDFATKMDSEIVFIKSPFRDMIEHEILSEYVIPLANDNWWHGFQHGLALLTHMAPYAYHYNINMLYIASTYCIADKLDHISDKSHYSCASDPTIDNQVRFCGCQVKHDGYELTRQDKLYNICDYSLKRNKSINIRVCWETMTGNNCCICEKCTRTILGIYTEKQDPKDYGFHYEESMFEEIFSNFNRNVLLNLNKTKYEFNVYAYRHIQKRLKENYRFKDVDKSLKLFYKVKLDKIFKVDEKYINKVRRKYL